ncbi:Uncharacterised protein [Streptococcus pneumoniae]|nr:Uncharacterised protein [Streptococcus pneumoniae]
MKLNDFLKPELLGNKFLAVKGYTEVLDRETNKPVALRLNVSIQDENSDFFMEMIQVMFHFLKQNKSILVSLIPPINLIKNFKKNGQHLCFYA